MNLNINKMVNDMVNISSKDDSINKILSKLPSSKLNPIKRDWLIHRKDIPTLAIELESLHNFNIEYLEKLNSITRKPFKHQEEARDFLLDRKRAILSDEMGGGKTHSAILACNEIRGKKLVVCPASLKYNWEKEIRMTTDEEIIIINDGNIWNNISSDGWTIINYDLLQQHEKNIIQENYTVSVFDEVHYCRSIDRKGNPKSTRAKMMLSISQDIEYNFMLSGTPVVNSNKDLFNLLKVVRHPLGNDFFHFAQLYCGAKIGNFGWEFDGSSRQEELFVRLKYKMLRRLKVDLLDLPKKIRTFIPLSVDLKEYNNKIDEYMKEKTLLRTEGRHLVHLNAMRKTIALEKTKHTIELADSLLEEGKPIVIFTNYEDVLNSIMDKYGSSAMKISGGVSSKKRNEAVEKFQNGEINVLVCNLIAGGVGLTLIRSHNLIVNDFSWIPAEHLQAEDRVHRIGQDKECNIYYMYAKDTIDEKMSSILEHKLSNISKTVNGVQESFVGELMKMF
jgi:SWI/SNF-related matrix-associated actin-dependent regulator 1 of chromatin subfamily A